MKYKFEIALENSEVPDFLKASGNIFHLTLTGESIYTSEIGEIFASI